MGDKSLKHTVPVGGTGDKYSSLWKKVKQGQPDECWLWIGATIDNAGVIHNSKIKGAAHRLAYEAATGEDITGVAINQTCGNGLCCNPAHLRKGRKIKISA